MGSNALDERLRAYYEAWGTGDPNKVLAFFDDTSVFEDLAFEAKFEGIPAIRSFVLLTYAGVPDFRVDPQVIVGDGNRAAAAWTMSGTHRGDLPGFPATGKRFQVRASSIIELDDGTIRRIVDYWNPVAFRKQVSLP